MNSTVTHPRFIDADHEMIVAVPCNPPCEKIFTYIGRSWHKSLGYGSVCGCAWVALREANAEDDRKQEEKLEREIKQAEARKKINDDKVKRKIVEWQQWMKRLCEDAGIPEQVMNMGVTADLDEMVDIIKCSDEFYDRILQQVEVDIASEEEESCVGCGNEKISVTECGGEKGINMCNKCFGIPSDDEDSDEEAEFTCDTCDCELDPNDLINGFHDQSVYQCADCFDNDQSEDEAETEREQEELEAAERKAHQEWNDLHPYNDREEDAGACNDCGAKCESHDDSLCHYCFHHSYPTECWCQNQ